MIPNMFGNKDHKRDIEAEQRGMNFGREQMGFQAAVHPDQLELEQQEAKSDLLKWQQDLQDELEILKNRLRRLVKQDGKLVALKQLIGYDKEKKPVYQKIPPYMNEVGISMVEDQIYPLISRNLINSNLTEERILKVLEETSNTIADNMADFYDLYQIDFINFDVVMRLIKNTIIPAPFRALNDGERRHQRTMNKRIEAFHDSPNQEKKKILGLFG